MAWALLSANPSNVALNRVWSFQLNGTLSHTTRDTYTIEYNLDNVEAEYLISFEGQAIGSLILSNSFFVVNEKNLTFTYVDTPTQKRIVLHLDAQICPVKEGRTREFLLNFYLNDAANSCTVSLVYNGTQQEINTSQIYASWDGVSTLFIQFLAFSVSTVFICITNATEGSQFQIIFQLPPPSSFTFLISSGSSSFQTIQPNTQYTWSEITNSWSSS
jgi:hypothetical protein